MFAIDARRMFGECSFAAGISAILNALLAAGMIALGVEALDAPIDMAIGLTGVFSFFPILGITFQIGSLGSNERTWAHTAFMVVVSIAGGIVGVAITLAVAHWLFV